MPSTRPDWLVDDPADEHDLGTLRSGKEAQIDVVERVAVDGRSCLLARKRYLPRNVTAKGTLEALGVQRSSAFRHDVEYREGRQFRKTRDRRAVEAMTTYGRKLLQDRWLGHEHDVLMALHESGCAVPYPVSYADDVLVMEYVGARDGAAPQLAAARLSPDEVRSAWHDVVQELRRITAAGWAHGDLSAYNVLWWEGTVWFIDFPQAVDIAQNPQGLGFLHRDVANITAWFARRGVEEDPEALFADLLSVAFG